MTLNDRTQQDWKNEPPRDIAGATRPDLDETRF